LKLTHLFFFFFLIFVFSTHRRCKTRSNRVPNTVRTNWNRFFDRINCWDRSNTSIARYFHFSCFLGLNLNGVMVQCTVRKCWRLQFSGITSTWRTKVQKKRLRWFNLDRFLYICTLQASDSKAHTNKTSTSKSMLLCRPTSSRRWK
jgi:hypothetical protein